MNRTGRGRHRLLQIAAALALLAAALAVRHYVPHGSPRRMLLLAALPVIAGTGLALLLALAARDGMLRPLLQPIALAALGVIAILYALASGFAPLPFGSPAMMAGMTWLALWLGVYLYRAPDPASGA